jgi:hypothetical protein
VAIGGGGQTQGSKAVAIGASAGNRNQGNKAVAVGYAAGGGNQGESAVAIGWFAGGYSQGANAVAIGVYAGYGSYLGITYQPANSIVINASGDRENLNSALHGSAQNACYIRPIRTSTAAGVAANVLFYNPNTSELIYGAKTTASATASSKTFVIDHPTNANKYLVHACLEGPESGVYYRGHGKIVNNCNTTIHLPDYVEHLASEFTIQITQIYSGRKMEQLCTGPVENNAFTVYGENCEFYWDVTGKRGNIEVEPLKDTTTVKGSGPYKWI